MRVISVGRLFIRACEVFHGESGTVSPPPPPPPRPSRVDGGRISRAHIYTRTFFFCLFSVFVIPCKTGGEKSTVKATRRSGGDAYYR